MFCSKCGNQLPDGARFCEYCGAMLEEKPATPPVVETPVVPVEPVQPVYQAPVQPEYQAPAQPVYQQPVYQAPSQPVYQAPPQPSEPNAFAKAFSKIPVFIKSPSAAAQSMADDKEFASAGILTGLLAISAFMYFLCYALKPVLRYNSELSKYDYIYDYFTKAEVNVGYVFLASILLTVLLATAFVMANALCRLVFAKDASFGQMLGGAFAEFSMYSLPFSAGLLLSGIVALINISASNLLLVLFAIYYIVAMVDTVSAKIKGLTNNLLKLLLTLGFVSLITYILYHLFPSMQYWTYTLPY